MLCVIPFCQSDVRQAIDLCRWIGELGGVKEHDCLLVPDCATDFKLALECHLLCGEAFKSVRMEANEKTVAGWIPGSVSLFNTAAQAAEGRVWFWLEPDAVPLKTTWLDDLERAYWEIGKPFLGALISHQNPTWPNPYLEGCAVYPKECWKIMAPHWKDDVSWTRSCASEIVPLAANTPLIHHLWGEENRPPTFAEKNVPYTNVFCPAQIRKEAVLFHRCKDGSLIRLLRKAAGLLPNDKTFCHGGDLGDLIYGLCAVKAAGGGELYLVPHAVREPFNQAKAEIVLPLLQIQPYLRKAEFHQCDIIPFGSGIKPDFIQHDLNGFRPLQFSMRAKGFWENISETHLRLLGLDRRHANNGPWLTVDKVYKIDGKPIVFHRSPRYRNAHFPWRRAWQKYGKRAVFIGLPFEHQQFQSQVGPIQYFQTRNLLDVARVIAGSELFIGNQSAPYAIAEGLKHHSVLEACPGMPDCIFKRDNLIVGRKSDCPLPDIP